MDRILASRSWWWRDAGITWPQHSKMLSCHLRKVPIYWSMWELCPGSIYKKMVKTVPTSFQQQPCAAGPRRDSAMPSPSSEYNLKLHFDHKLQYIVHILVELVELNFCPLQPKEFRFQGWEHLKNDNTSPPIWCSWFWGVWLRKCGWNL